MTDENPHLDPIAPDEAIDIYLEERSLEVSKNTVQSYRYRLQHFIRWCEEEGVSDMNGLSGRDLHRYKVWRKDDGDLNRVSLKSQMDTFRSFIRFCEGIQAVPDGLSDSILSPTVKAGENQRDVRLESERATEILAFLGRYHFASFPHVLLTLFWSTGIRMGTSRAFDVDDFDPERQWLQAVHRPDQNTNLKNGEEGERYISLSADDCRVVQEWIDHRRPDVTDDFGRQPLLATKQGRASKNTIRSTVYEWTCPCKVTGECPHGRVINDCEAIQDKKRVSKCPSSVSPHAIRRGSITHHLTEDVPEKVVSDRMNVSQEVLDKHYDRRSEEVKVEQRREFLDF